MQGSPPPTTDRVTIANWQDPPFNRWAFSHMRELVPTQAVRNTGPVRLIDYALNDDLDQVQVGRIDGGFSSLQQLLEDTYTDGIVVIQDDQIRYERYFGETRQETPHLLMSVTKSLVGCVAGNLIERGILKDDELLTSYIPELHESGYANATVRHVLDMRSGVKFSEEYTDPKAEVRVMEQAFGWRPVGDHEHDLPMSLYGYLATLGAEREHGGMFDYRSAETLALGWVCERASGARMADLISHYLWTPMGAVYEGAITCDGIGSAIHDGGMCASAVDLAKFGHVLLHKGHIGDVEIVPPNWLRSSWRVDPDIRDAFDNSKSGPYLPGGWYRNQFWFLPRKHGDVLLCLGIYGQMLYVNPGTKTVIAKLSTWPEAQNPNFLSETIAAFDTLGAQLAGLPTDTGSSHEGPGGVATGHN